MVHAKPPIYAQLGIASILEISMYSWLILEISLYEYDDDDTDYIDAFGWSITSTFHRIGEF